MTTITTLTTAHENDTWHEALIAALELDSTTWQKLYKDQGDYFIMRETAKRMTRCYLTIKPA